MRQLHAQHKRRQQMTNEEPFLICDVAQPALEGRSGVNGFAHRFAELRSFAAKNLRSRENNRE
ncbi:MAG: hypothetical protein DME42_04025 [Verrucomicrobia bacterium]|nr:MAG: hypothetical protein DME42_04025 [Verrucomicrobiota bacterium]